MSLNEGLFKEKYLYPILCKFLKKNLRIFFLLKLISFGKFNFFLCQFPNPWRLNFFHGNFTPGSIFLKGASSLSSDDIKLSERLYIPGKRLRGFETGKIGPKDGNDFIGGNYVTALNFNSSLPQIMPNAQNLDVSLFFDAAKNACIDGLIPSLLNFFE